MPCISKKPDVSEEHVFILRIEIKPNKHVLKMEGVKSSKTSVNLYRTTPPTSHTIVLFIATAVRTFDSV
jgi:hypothetical protein